MVVFDAFIYGDHAKLFKECKGADEVKFRDCFVIIEG